MTRIEPKSKRGASRLIDALIRAYRRKFSGGGQFGFDWPTMRLNDPETYGRLMEIKAVYDRLPD
jgi:hypothetical protein